MKVAIVMNGHFRTLPKCWPGMRKMFDGHDLDITVVSSEPEKCQEFWDIVKPNRLLLIPEPTPEQLPDIRGWNAPAHISGIVQAWKSMQAWWTVKGIKCGLMCRLRPDLEILEPLEPLESFNRYRVYLPKFNNWTGHNGQFMIGSPERIKEYFARLLTMPLYGGHPGDEKFLQWHLGPFVERTNIKFNLLREDGSREAPRYNTGGDIVD